MPAVKRVCALASGQGIVARFAEKQVVTRLSLDHIVAVATIDRIGPVPAPGSIIAVARHDQIVARAPIKKVRPAQPIQHIVAKAARHHIGVFGAPQGKIFGRQPVIIIVPVGIILIVAGTTATIVTRAVIGPISPAIAAARSVVGQIRVVIVRACLIFIRTQMASATTPAIKAPSKVKISIATPSPFGVCPVNQKFS